MGPREGPLLAFGAVALAVGLAILDTASSAQPSTWAGSRSSCWNGRASSGLWLLRLRRCGRFAASEPTRRACARSRPGGRPGRWPGLRPGAAHGDPAASMRHQFESWELTPAEADIAALILKGVSVRDIALLRGTSEATIRQQAQGIYRKAGLGGRAELAAFFLEFARSRAPAIRPAVLPIRGDRSAPCALPPRAALRCLADDAPLHQRRALAAVERRAGGRPSPRRPWCGAGCGGRTRPRSAVW